MKNALISLLLLGACQTEGHRTFVSEAIQSTSKHGSADQADENCQLPELRAELLAMLELDQKIRTQDHAVVIVGDVGGTDHNKSASPGHQHSQDHPNGASGIPVYDPEIHDNLPVHGQEMNDVDAANTARLKEIVSTHGWPGRRLVGEDGALAAFLIVQHADSDPAFQQECLDLMQGAAKGDVSSNDVAYLTDRVRVNSGRPQLYGTQFWFYDGELQPRPIEDEDRLDERRLEAGMITMAEYRKHMATHDQGGHHSHGKTPLDR